MRIWLTLALAFLAASTAPAQSSHDPYPTPKTPTDPFTTLRADWARNLHDKKIDASVAQYAPDAEFIDPGGNRIVGTQALRQLFTTVTQTFDSDLKFQSQRVVTSSDLAYDSGTYHETLMLRSSGKQQLSTGSYLTVYQRTNSSPWLITEQVWTGSITDAPPATAELDPHPVLPSPLTIYPPPVLSHPVTIAPKSSPASPPNSTRPNYQAPTDSSTPPSWSTIPTANRPSPLGSAPA